MNLKSFLKFNKLSQGNFSKISGVPQGVLSDICAQKKKRISAITAIKIQLATQNKVTIADVVGASQIKKIARKIEKNLAKRS